MAIEDEVRRIVAAEMQSMLKPYRSAMERLAAAATEFAAMAAGGGETEQAPRRRGRPPGAAKAKGTVSAARAGAGEKPCGIIGCKREARSKGYCSAHYQKRRNLEKSRRLPAAWIENPEPHSVEDLKLPRGRAAAKKADNSTAA